MQGEDKADGHGWQDNPEWDEALSQRRDIVITGGESPSRRPSTAALHRAGEIVVDNNQYEEPEDLNGFRDVLDRLDVRPFTPDDVRDDREREREEEKTEAAKRLGLLRLTVPEKVDLPDLIRRLRELSPGAAALNAIVVANPQRYGGCSPPRADAAPDFSGLDKVAEGKTIAVLDTGIAEKVPFEVDPGSDPEPLDELPAGQPGPAVGHGTFVAGIVARYAPGARILVRRVLRTPLGEADELDIAAALLKLEKVDIVNLSFGGLAVDDATMLTFERALNALPRTTLVVASAGNQDVTRPHYPAAFKRVVSVGSAEGGRDDVWERASYSNHGGWVDCCAQGTDVHSTFIHFPGLFDGGAIASGTSFAAPQVTATAAVLAAREGIPVRRAAHLLIQDQRRRVVEDVGTIIDPTDPP